jgi:hypothetical protein
MDTQKTPLPTVLFLRHSNRTDCIENTTSQLLHRYVLQNLLPSDGMCLQSRSIAMAVSSGFTVLALSIHEHWIFSVLCCNG